MPRFSPDGKTIAFVGNYDGNMDLYTLPVSGGVPFRVTYHPAFEMLSDWTADGRLIFASSMYSAIGRAPKLFLQSAKGGMPELLPVPYGGAGAIDESGERADAAHGPRLGVDTSVRGLEPFSQRAVHPGRRQAGMEHPTIWSPVSPGEDRGELPGSTRVPSTKT